MDKEKARVVLARALQPYRAKSYAELRGLIGQVDAHEVTPPSAMANSFTTNRNTRRVNSISRSSR